MGFVSERCKWRSERLDLGSGSPDRGTYKSQWGLKSLIEGLGGYIWGCKENCPMWTHKALAPPGPLPKKDLSAEGNIREVMESAVLLCTVLSITELQIVFSKKRINSQRTKHNRYIYHSVGFDPTHWCWTKCCKQQLVVEITAGCKVTKLAKIQFSPNRMRPADS